MKKITVLLVVIVLLVVGFFVWWMSGLRAADSKNSQGKVFVIEKGDTIREIGNKLKKEGLIRDPVIFFLYVKKNNQDTKIQAGTYRLSPSLRLPDLVENLTHGTLDVWVTIPEGIRADEIADILEETFEQYDESWRDKLNLYEGYLFPDTYLVPKDAGIDTIIAIMRANFDSKVADLGLAGNSDLERIIIIASLIEREARLPDEKVLVSSVIHNRLNIGMKLDIDATVQYALGYQKDEKRWWKRALTRADLARQTPYNTYLNAGLPPTPISNPGSDALQAAANPAETDYMYYLTDGDGNTYFAKDYEEHQNNIEKYLR